MSDRAPVSRVGVTYLTFDKINPGDFLAVLNSDKVREHLIAHDRFTLESVTAWMASKIAIDQEQGCRIRAVVVGGQLAGWCGIQREGDQHELAIILGDASWGLGRRLFQDLMRWADELNHDVVYINLLHTRPRYQFLIKRAIAVTESSFLGESFTRYALKVR